MRTTRSGRVLGAAATTIVAIMASSTAAFGLTADDDPATTGSGGTGSTTTTVPPPTSGPNLRITGGSLVDAGTDVWDATVTIANSGTAGAPSFRVGFVDENGTFVTGRDVAGLSAGQSATHTFRISDPRCLPHLKVMADSLRAVTETSEADNGRRLDGPVTCRKYVAEAVQFTAVDESDDFGNSDEPYWVFSAAGAAGTAQSNRTAKFDDVDSGETRVFSTQRQSCVFADTCGTDRCVWVTSCKGAPVGNGLGVTVQMWEEDVFGDSDDIQAAVHRGFQAAGIIASLSGAPSWVTKAIPYVDDAVKSVLGSLEDDYQGSQTWAYSASDLANRLPDIGSAFTETKAFGRYDPQPDTAKDTDYRLTVRVRRTA